MRGVRPAVRPVRGRWGPGRAGRGREQERGQAGSALDFGAPEPERWPVFLLEKKHDFCSQAGAWRTACQQPLPGKVWGLLGSV